MRLPLSVSARLCCFCVDNRTGLLALTFIEAVWLVFNAVLCATDFNLMLYNSVMRLDYFRSVETNNGK
jgi:hypothetical protein